MSATRPEVDVDVEEIGSRVGRLLDQLAARDPRSAALAEDLVRSLLLLHGAGLDRIVTTLRARSPLVLDQLADDVLVAGLLALHDLAPTGPASAVQRAVDAAVSVTEPQGVAEAFIPLEALRRRPEETGQHRAACHLCSAPMGDDHRHVVDLDQRGILCTCRACGVLFTGGSEQHEHFRTVPDRFLRVEPFAVTAPQWAALQIPVGVSFVIDDSRLGRPVAFYPSPGGATQSELSLDAWDEVVDANPGLADLQPDVEAVLVRNERGQEPRCHIVPVDRCYELVGALRVHWRGFDGGQEVRDAITAFFTDLDARARRVSGAAR